MQVKHCPACGEDKPLSEFHRNRRSPDGRVARCRLCISERDKRYRSANRDSDLDRKQRYRTANSEKTRAWNRSHYKRLRDAVFSHYGRSCACCGSDKQLSIDHVDGDGRQHREGLNRGRARTGKSAALYRWLVREGFPDGFQVLCLRCNTSKGDGATCRLDHAKVVAR